MLPNSFFKKRDSLSPFESSFHAVVWGMCYPEFRGGEGKNTEQMRGTKLGRMTECETVWWANRIETEG